MGPRASNPLARKADLLLRELDDELLVYDSTRHTAHCLNAQAAAIWRQCTGQNSSQMIAASIGAGSDVRHNEGIVAVVLEQLREAQLLVEPGSQDTPDLSRRAALQKVGTAAAALAIPFVISIVAPEAAQAITICLPTGAPCISETQCCSRVCGGNNMCG